MNQFKKFEIANQQTLKIVGGNPVAVTPSTPPAPPPVLPLSLSNTTVTTGTSTALTIANFPKN